jgi:AIPR protein
MADNELVLLDQVLAQRQSERLVPIRDDEAFELFASEQIMRERDISPEEISAGIVGGGNDGGLDAIYVFLGDVLVTEDSDVFDSDYEPRRSPTGVRLEIWLIQAKQTPSFTETAIEKVSDSTRRLLSLNESEADLLALYSPAVVKRTGFFRDTLRVLASRHPQVEIHFSYASRGQVEGMNEKVGIKGAALEKQLAEVVTGGKSFVDFVGAAELWRLTSSLPSYTSQLSYQENATSGNSHVALVSLTEYMKFLSDEHGNLRRNIFDWNVRDYQGDVEVNKEIRSSLESVESPEFWWLNNGVTVVCSRASAVGKTYSLDDVQIVNGLQTSQTIYDVLRFANEDHPAFGRTVLVRILVTGDDLTVRDRVIRATNRQTSVPAASLRATDEIQRDIEAYFLNFGWFYDRRKNYYRNQGKNADKIVSIPLLAQSVMAMGLSRPDNSRARPSSLLKRDDEYETIFNSALPLEVYLWCASSQREIDAYLGAADTDVTPQERTNLRFYIAMAAATKLVGERLHSPSQLTRTVRDGKKIGDANLDECLDLVRKCFEEANAETGFTFDRIAKGPDFVERVLGKLLPT